MSEINFVNDYIEYKPKDVAKALENFVFDESYQFLKNLSLTAQVTLFREMDPGLSASLLPLYPKENLQSILKELSIETLAKILQMKKGQERDDFYEVLPPNLKEKVHHVSGFLPESAGFFMDITIPALDDSLTVEKALEILRVKKNFSYYLYFVDESGKLSGVSSIRRMLIERDTQKLCHQFMSGPVEALKLDYNRHDIISSGLWNRFSTVPVVDYQEKFKGVITYNIYNRLRIKDEVAQHNQSLQSTGKALGELYSIGLSALFESASSLQEIRNKDE